MNFTTTNGSLPSVLPLLYRFFINKKSEKDFLPRFQYSSDPTSVNQSANFFFSFVPLCLLFQFSTFFYWHKDYLRLALKLLALIISKEVELANSSNSVTLVVNALCIIQACQYNY